ncbi:hypothetical protein HYH03_004201 [Edaphochlamys debaryana]|uniref:RAP domain-containing protein n=1 Tax=Edaphochlamys debaryana TaxID=47281 RepID=A0A835YA43_9CHLO|nr:hypothetical protein HYH03_004201 [Edaphochlamys debaryana]|eukprot:KAG2497939.1 hypothetical protein HYH03_004201 [Edaphochlamys debaryana]
MVAEVKACRDLGALEALVVVEVEGWSRASNNICINTALSQAARLGADPRADTARCHRIFDLLGAALVPLAPHISSATSCTIPLNACAKAGYWRGGLAVALLQRLSEDGGALLAAGREQDLTDLWWVLPSAPPEVRSCIDLGGLLEVSTEAVLETPLHRSGNCSKLLVACSRLQLSGVDRLAHRLTERVAQRGLWADCYEVANTLYALGKLAEGVGHTPRPEDLQGLAREVVARLSAGPDSRDVFNPQHLSNMLYACAMLGCTDSDLILSLSAAAGRAAGGMKPQELANSLYSLALLQPSISAHGGAAEALAEECTRHQFAAFKPQELTISAWALAKLGYRYASQGWYAALVAATERRGAMRGAKTQEWSNLWYALALVRHRPASGRLLQLTAEAAALLRQGAKPQECANLLWALANLRLYDERLVGALTGRLGQLLTQDPDQIKTQELCNSLWALAVMGPDVLSRHSGLVEGLLREAVRRWEAKGDRAFIKEELSQLWQAQLELEAMGGGELQSILRAGEGGGGSLLSRARVVAAGQAVEGNCPSTAEDQLASALQRLQEQLGPLGAIRAVRPGFEVEGLGRVADVVVELAEGRRVAVEFDGPHHYFANSRRDAHAVDGPTALRNRQLERGFGRGSVLSMPGWQWQEARGEAERRSYLCQLLGLGAAA